MHLRHNFYEDARMAIVPVAVQHVLERLTRPGTSHRQPDLAIIDPHIMHALLIFCSVLLSASWHWNLLDQRCPLDSSAMPKNDKALTAKRPPPAGPEYPKASMFMLDGAGDASWNGHYKLDGSKGGLRSYCSMKDAAKKIYADASGRWVCVAEPEYCYFAPGGSGPRPPTGGWAVQRGAAPAPKLVWNPEAKARLEEEEKDKKAAVGAIFYRFSLIFDCFCDSFATDLRLTWVYLTHSGGAEERAGDGEGCAGGCRRWIYGDRGGSRDGGAEDCAVAAAVDAVSEARGGGRIRG